MKRKLAFICVLSVIIITLNSFIIAVEAGFTDEFNIKSNGRINKSTLSSYVLNQYTYLSYSDGNISEISRLFDMMQADWYSYSKIQLIHELNPNCTALLYRTIRSIYNYSKEWQQANDNGWLLKDEKDNLIYSTEWPENYFADIGNPQYQKWVAMWIKNTTNYYGFDGVFADGALVAEAKEYFLYSSTTPINPRTGQQWTDIEVRQALTEIYNEIKNTIGSKPLIANGIWQGTSFWIREKGYTEMLQTSLDGIMSEGIWYQNKGSWMTENQWLDSVYFFEWIQENFLRNHPERAFIAYCKLAELPTGVNRDQMALYAFASTLLCLKSNQVYLGLISDFDYATQITQQLFNLNVGSPEGDYYVINGTHVYARDFSNVKVIINPTPNSYVVDLQGTYTTLNGEKISTLTIQGYTGQVLITLKE